MHRKTFLLTLLSLIVLLTGCKKELKPDQLAPGVQPGQVYYTQFSLFQEKNNFRTTNYRKGILIPINTAVSLQSIRADQAELRLVESGQPLSIENVPKHTVDDMQTAFKKIAGPNKVDLSQFSATEKDAILAGQVKKGMSRKAVLAAIGYPPQNETPSLNSNDWTYWSNRFNRFIVHFKNDKVDNIVD
ncbi:MAG: outer membrane protein assembly factor BamE [Methylomonas sp.]|jgi:hypothetical protein|uniref:hypothetical protein n=1 Tax=Methylomonas sp. TaxID=418 RepID=UPI0025E16521|nr:hypothetical protein [Methylomonas sp.]MCK9606567.1 outer membrane protein assembly factor BamE [Methylomonas sp.]